MNPLEALAVLLGLANIVLIVRRNVWNYPFGLAMVALYAWIFSRADVRLYSDALLQIFFFAVQLYGWWHWAHAPEAAGGVAVRRLAGRARAGIAAAVLVATALWGAAMARWTDADLPWWDGFIAMASVAAQILLARRFVENWAGWVAVDLVAIGVYAHKGLLLTAALYVIFLGLSVWGWIGWRDSMKTE